MDIQSYQILENKIIIRLDGDQICETPEEVLSSALFRDMCRRAIGQLAKRNSYLLKIFDRSPVREEDIDALINTLKWLHKMPYAMVQKTVKASDSFLKEPHILNDFIEYLYNYWRSFDRFVNADSTGKDLDKKPYRTFHSTIGQLTDLIRGMYRDMQENITGNHPRVYRQVTAGAEVSTISSVKQVPLPSSSAYQQLQAIPMIRQILLYPPLILNPSMNKRSGKFERVDKNPLESFPLPEEEWLCYPAKVGSLVILIYFHHQFAELGHSLCNLFQLAEDEDLSRQPDAVYAFGAPDQALASFGPFPTIFYDDEKNNILVGAVPVRKEFGYFGYLKKMVLTLHNIIMMKRGKMPFHGALIRMLLKGGLDKTVLFIGDTGAGKSETLEAFRELGESEIQDLIIIADDMGSLELGPKGEIIGYGTEIGAFLRLDDLQPGYALGQIDRAIIMSANQVNARIILPVTTFENVVRGQKIDLVLYANNYEDIDEEHPILERFNTVEQALNLFREGTVMSKGTTTTSGIVHSYFANVFGPPQYKELHEPLAKKYFQAFFDQGVFVGQIRTRLGLAGWERKGPEEAAKALLSTFLQNS